MRTVQYRGRRIETAETPEGVCLWVDGLRVGVCETGTEDEIVTGVKGIVDGAMGPSRRRAVTRPHWARTGRTSLKETWTAPAGAIARPKVTGRPELIIVGRERKPFVCGGCRGEAEILMPARGPHRETPLIDYQDDPLEAPVCEDCHHLMNCRDPYWDLEIRARWEEHAMRHESGEDVVARPSLLCKPVKVWHDTAARLQ